MGENEIVEKLMEEHKGDFETTETSTNDERSNSGGDNSSDNSQDAPTGNTDSIEDESAKSDDSQDGKEEAESEKDQSGSTESDDSVESGFEQVGQEKDEDRKDANSRIRQLNEEKKLLAQEKEALAEEKRLIEERLAEKEAAERHLADLAEDPVYTEDDFIGTLDENGDILTDNEARARFRAWEADYKLRQYEKKEVLREQQRTLLDLQSQTKEAFTKFPEFNATSSSYDPELAAIANDAFRAGLIYAPGFEGDDRYIVGSRIHPGELLEKLHNLRAKKEPVTKVNNLGDDTGSVVSSQQVAKRVNQYAPGFRGEVDREIDKLIKEIK